ncbi:hypothetical protein WMF38_01250 [Sorangium sp. So ce118]
MRTRQAADRLPHPSPPRCWPRSNSFGIRSNEIVDGDMPHETSWGQHLTLASGRRIRLLTAEALG